MTDSTVMVAADLPAGEMETLLDRYRIDVCWLPPDAEIVGSFWGAPEAGIVGSTVYARPDTPIHSLLHEACHIVCMPTALRKVHRGDAASDDIEEAAVCFLQITLAAALPSVGGNQLMADMDAWGYSFRLGSTARWYAEDATDASDWLIQKGLLDNTLAPTFQLRA